MLIICNYLKENIFMLNTKSRYSMKPDAELQATRYFLSSELDILHYLMIYVAETCVLATLRLIMNMYNVYFTKNAS